MTKFRTSILICGCIVLCVIGALVAFLTLSASGMIVSDPIEISVRVDDNRKEYDGTPLSAESYRVTSGELLKGHELQITFVGSQTAVGASAGTADIKVTDAKKRDVSKQYVFTVTPCLLEVTQRTVSFVQENVTREYTGGGVAGGNYFLEKGTLCAGHHVLRSGIDVVAEVGRDVEDPAEPRIYDALGADVTANYAVHCTRGLISVQRRALTIAPIGATKTYDGTPLSPEGYRVVSGSLVDGHRLEVTYTAENGVASVVDAEEIAVRIAEATVWDADGKDVTNNYSIDKDATAVLKIEPCPITVTGKSAAFTYNGMAHAIADDHEPQSYAGDLAGNGQCVYRYDTARRRTRHAKLCGAKDNGQAVRNAFTRETHAQVGHGVVHGAGASFACQHLGGRGRYHRKATRRTDGKYLVASRSRSEECGRISLHRAVARRAKLCACVARRYGRRRYGRRVHGNARRRGHTV